MDIVFSTQARMGSSRLPGKVLLPIGEKRVIEWVLHQADVATTSTSAIITIGDQPENSAIKRWADRSDYDYLIGPENDLLTRYCDIIEKRDCSLLVRVTGDCPFVPPSEIDRVVNAHRMNDSNYTTNRTEAMPIGTAVDVINPNILRQLPDTIDHPVKPLLDHPQDWKITFTGSERWEKYSNAHIAVDTPEDYWTLTDAVNEVGKDPYSITQWLASRNESDNS